MLRLILGLVLISSAAATWSDGMYLKEEGLDRRPRAGGVAPEHRAPDGRPRAPGRRPGAAGGAAQLRGPGWRVRVGGARAGPPRRGRRGDRAGDLPPPGPGRRRAGVPPPRPRAGCLGQAGHERRPGGHGPGGRGRRRRSRPRRHRTWAATAPRSSRRAALRACWVGCAGNGYAVPDRAAPGAAPVPGARLVLSWRSSSGRSSRPRTTPLDAGPAIRPPPGPVPRAACWTCSRWRSRSPASG